MYLYFIYANLILTVLFEFHIFSFGEENIFYFSSQKWFPAYSSEIIVFNYLNELKMDYARQIIH